jgi:integrase
MAKIQLKYTVADIDRHGNVRHYFRRHGRKVRLPGLPGSAEYMTAYHQALTESAAPSPVRPPALKADSFTGLVRQFYQSATFKSLTPRSQRVRQLILDKFCDKYGAMPYRLMERRHVQQFRDKIADRPGSATNLIKALRHVFSFAVDYGLAEHNPAKEVRYLHKKNGGFHSWTIEEVRQFEVRHPIGSKARLAMALLFYTGQRRSDVVTFGPQNVRDGKLHFVQIKTGRKMTIPILPQLREVIDASPSRGPTFLATRSGTPYSANGFGNAFRDWCNEAGLPHCSSHGLRKALGARLAEKGASINYIKDALGHLTLSEAARYTAAADQERNADAAFALMIEEQKPNTEVLSEEHKPNISVPLPSTSKSGGTKSRKRPTKSKSI